MCNNSNTESVFSRQLISRYLISVPFPVRLLLLVVVHHVALAYNDPNFIPS